MPVEVIRPMSRQEEIREDRQKITTLESYNKKFFIFNMAVAVNDQVVDFTDIPSGLSITGALPAGQKSVTFKVQDGVNVFLADPQLTHAKVIVETESGERYKPPGYLYWTRTNFSNINGKHRFNDPNFTGNKVTIPIKVDSETYSIVKPVYEHLPIFCGHFTVAALKLRGRVADWKKECDRHFAVVNLPKVFNGFQMIEDIHADIIISTRHTYATFKPYIGQLLYGMLCRLGYNMPPDSVREKKYYALMANSVDPASEKHACAVILRCKTNAEGYATFKIKVYDPNITYNSLSMIDSPEMGFIRNMSFEDLFVQHSVYQAFDSVYFYELNPEWNNGKSQIAETLEEDGELYQYKYSVNMDTLVCAKKNPLVERLERFNSMKEVEESPSNN